MDIPHLIAFNVALLAAISTPGPGFLLAVRTTLHAGQRTGIAVGFGLGTMAAGWTLMALLGFEAVFGLFPWAYSVCKTVGAAYLLFIALRMWKNAGREIASRARPVRHAFAQGILVNLLNPKSVLFAGAVLIVVFPGNLTIWEDGLVVLNHLLVEWLFYTVLAVAMSTTAAHRTYLRAKVYANRIAAAMLGALGLRLFLSR